MNWQLVSLFLIVALSTAPLWLVLIAMLFRADIGPHSSWAAVPWLIFYSLPAGLVALAIWLGTILYLSMKN